MGGQILRSVGIGVTSASVTSNERPWPVINLADDARVVLLYVEVGDWVYGARREAPRPEHPSRCGVG